MEIFQQYENLVFKVAKMIWRRVHVIRLGNSFDDLIQEGRIGLWRASQEYDSSRRMRFLSYAWNKVRWQILRGCLKSNSVISVPAHLLGKGKWKETVRTALATRSLWGNANHESIRSRIAAHDVADYRIQSKKFLEEVREQAERAVDALSQIEDRLRIIILCRFFLDLTLYETGLVMDLSKERVRHLEVRALDKLRAIVE